MKRKPVDLDAQLRSQPAQLSHRFGFAAEFARQIAARLRAAKGQPDQHRTSPLILGELAQLIRIIDDESVDAVIERGADIAVAFNRVGMDAALRRDLQPAHQLHLAIGRQIEAGACGVQGRDH